jgi:outer membrane immunogenic protein
MKGMLLAGIALVALAAGPALAADMPVKAPILAPPPAAYNWTGFFTGASLGSQSWDISGIYQLPPVDPHHSEATRGVFGGHIGAQYQVNSWVLGVEAAYNSPFSHSFSSTVSPSGDCLGISGTVNRQCSSRIDNSWTAGARLGYAFDRGMIYGTGGYAAGRVDTRTNVATTGAPLTSTSVNQSGWFAGAGAEYFVTKFLWSDLILGAEYQHIDLGSARHVDQFLGAPVDTRNVKATEDVARARMIFKWTPN